MIDAVIDCEIDAVICIAISFSSVTDFGRYKTLWFWKKGSIHLKNLVITHYNILRNISLYCDTKEVIF